MGDPPHRYILRRQVAKARDMLRFGHAPLAEIAVGCGFSSQSRLTHVFAQEMGVTPGALRAARTRARARDREDAAEVG